MPTGLAVSVNCVLKSSLHFPEPDFSYLEALAPYQPLAMKCIYCPIDTRLNFIQVAKLLKEVQVCLLCGQALGVAPRESALHSPSVKMPVPLQT